MQRFPEDVPKAIQAAGVLLRLARGRIERLRLLKLLYVADREAVAASGRPIVGGRILALGHGPVHDSVHALVRGEHSREREWAEFFDNEGHVVVVREEPDRMDLSPFEIEKLTEVHARFVDEDTWAVAEQTHGFPEWVACHVEGEARTIPVETILEAIGFSPDECDHVLRELAAEERLRNAFGRTPPCPAEC